ncbi:hypothetical protein SAY86_031382 [Trapa natans]|uniref:Uncharacterized protein n=1 Tax=Trapa natans TaxID=22666 RepID=A0AAN7R3H6_TRANT|nr:hypothetical protein SAY86_031382 [Trapa natans]
MPVKDQSYCHISFRLFENFNWIYLSATKSRESCKQTMMSTSEHSLQVPVKSNSAGREQHILPLCALISNGSACSTSTACFESYGEDLHYCLLVHLQVLELGVIAGQGCQIQC